MSVSRNENPNSETEAVTEHAGTSQKGTEQVPPEDKSNMVYVIFFLYGVGILLPLNAVFTAFDFFIAKVSSSTF